MFAPQAERRVRLGLIVGDLVRAQNLSAKPEQLQAHIEELSQSYEKPAEVVRWYLSDRQRMAEVEAVVVENNVTDYVMKTAKVTDKSVAFDELMARLRALLRRAAPVQPETLKFSDLAQGDRQIRGLRRVDGAAAKRLSQIANRTRAPCLQGRRPCCLMPASSPKEIP